VKFRKLDETKIINNKNNKEMENQLEIIKSKLIPVFESIKHEPDCLMKCLSASCLFSLALPNRDQVEELAKWAAEYVNAMLRAIGDISIKVIIDGAAKEELIKVTVTGDLKFADATPVSDANKSAFEELCLPIDQFFAKIWKPEKLHIRLGKDSSKIVNLDFAARVVAKTIFDAVKKSRPDMTDEIAFNICLEITDKYTQIAMIIHKRLMDKINREIAKVLTDDIKTGIMKSIITEGV
jgi:hypothetical protein